MGRKHAIARSITRAVAGRPTPAQARGTTVLGRILAFFAALFSLYQLPLHKIRIADFAHLRRNHWQVDDEAYVAAFQTGPDGAEVPSGQALQAMGDMGFSGSTFFSTANQQYLVKSVPRHFEHSFFEYDLLEPYVDYMGQHPDSLLIRICDFLGCTDLALGRTLRLAPSHHIVMNNILYGSEQAKAEWEHWDLKPTSYFYPERDIADGRLTSEATKNQLADEFQDKIVLGKQEAAEFIDALEKDTQFLADHNAVDYSLFLVRLKSDDPVAATDPTHPNSEAADVVPMAPPSVPPAPPSWRTGVPSSDGQHIFRAAILDFFWAKHKVQPMLMTLLIKSWDAITGHGPMSITTTPAEYRERFLKMCIEMVEIKEDVS